MNADADASLEPNENVPGAVDELLPDDVMGAPNDTAAPLLGVKPPKLNPPPNVLEEEALSVEGAAPKLKPPDAAAGCAPNVKPLAAGAGAVAAEAADEPAADAGRGSSHAPHLSALSWRRKSRGGGEMS